MAAEKKEKTESAVLADAERIKKEAEEEADRIVAEAMAKAKEIIDTAAETDKRPAGSAATTGKKVSIRLFKDNDKYKDDVFVAVNGVSYQVKRGVTVEVPDFVAEVLERSMEQDQATASLIEKESSAYEQEAHRLGIS